MNVNETVIEFTQYMNRANEIYVIIYTTKINVITTVDGSL